MTRPSQLAMLLLLLLAAPAGADCTTTTCSGSGVPCAAMSTIPPFILGTGATSASIPVQITVRDAGGTPLSGVVVILDFSSSIGPTHGNNLQPSGTTLNCATAQLSGVTNSLGTGAFTGAWFEGYEDGAHVAITADGVCLGNVPARSLDFVPDPFGRVGLAELGIFTGVYLNSGSVEHLDFDGVDGKPGLGDFAIFSTQFLAAQNGSLCSSGW